MDQNIPRFASKDAEGNIYQPNKQSYQIGGCSGAIANIMASQPMVNYPLLRPWALSWGYLKHGGPG